MTDPLPPPDGFRIGHWTDAAARTGCTVVIPPPGTRGGVDVRGGGTGTRELEALSPLANAEGPTAVLLTVEARSVLRRRTASRGGSKSADFGDRPLRGLSTRSRRCRIRPRGRRIRRTPRTG